MAVSYKTLWVMYVPEKDNVQLFCRQENAESAMGHMRDNSFRRVQIRPHCWAYYQNDTLVFTLKQQKIEDSDGLPK